MDLKCLAYCFEICYRSKLSNWDRLSPTEIIPLVSLKLVGIVVEMGGEREHKWAVLVIPLLPRMNIPLSLLTKLQTLEFFPNGSPSIYCCCCCITRLHPADRRLHKEAAPPVCSPKRLGLPILLTWGVPGKRWPFRTIGLTQMVPPHTLPLKRGGGHHWGDFIWVIARYATGEQAQKGFFVAYLSS